MHVTIMSNIIHAKWIKIVTRKLQWMCTDVLRLQFSYFSFTNYCFTIEQSIYNVNISSLATLSSNHVFGENCNKNTISTIIDT